MRTIKPDIVGGPSGPSSGGFRYIAENPVRIHRVQACRSPSGAYVARRQRYVPGGTVEIGEMVLPDCYHTASFKSFHLLAVGCLQRAQQQYVTGLNLVRSVRRDATQDDVVYETEFKAFKSFMRSKAIADKDPRSLVSPSLSLRVERELQPLQAELGVSVAAVRVCVTPPMSG